MWSECSFLPHQCGETILSFIKSGSTQDRKQLKKDLNNSCEFYRCIINLSIQQNSLLGMSMKEQKIKEISVTQSYEQYSISSRISLQISASLLVMQKQRMFYLQYFKSG